MPTYCYQCNFCGKDFEVRHSMSFDKQQCIYCKSTDIFKVPALSKPIQTTSSKPRTGRVVDDYIESTKKEIRKEKQKLKNREL